jgi:galactokinase
LLLDSDVPSGAGLSSSAAVECVTVLAVAELAGATLDRPVLALAAHRAEVEMAGVPCGTMDQMVSMCGQADHALFLDCRSLESKQVPLPLESVDLGLLVIDTRAPHRLVSGEYAARRRDCEAAAAALGVASLRDATLEQVEQATNLSAVQQNRARHVVTENARVLDTVRALEQGNLSEAGPMLTASLASLRDNFEVTVPELDVAAQAAVDAGALGARMIGGGFGGCVLALVRQGEAAGILAAVRQQFVRREFAVPSALLAQPSAGARRMS